MSYEKFNAKVWKQGASRVITIPEGVVKFGGYEEGDMIKVMCKKVVEEETERD